jgi:CheY-like chemotaxis protein
MVLPPTKVATTSAHHKAFLLLSLRNLENQSVMVSLLIVEDNEQMRRIIRSVVADLVADVYECCDGAEAMPAYVAHQLTKADWVLMDIAMPGIDGISATRQLKAAFPEAQICIVTNYCDAELRQAAQQAGAAGYVLKDDLFAVRRIITA